MYVLGRIGHMRYIVLYGMKLTYIDMHFK